MMHLDVRQPGRGRSGVGRLGVWTVAALALLAASCTTTPESERRVNGEEDPQGFHHIELVVSDANGVPGSESPAALEARIVALIDAARTEVVFAANRFDSLPIAQALLRAVARGVVVRGAGDLDLAGEPGFVTLTNANVPITFGDGPLVWNPQPGVDLIREGPINQMTQNIVVADVAQFVFLTGGLLSAEDPRMQVAAFGSYEELGRDARDVVEQLIGGTFATTLTAFDAPLSTDPNNRTIYPSQHEPWEFYFGPAEPLLKQVIDEIYDSRANVWIAAYQLSHAPLADALRYKAEAGFDVRIAIDEVALSAPGSQVERLEEAFEAIRSQTGLPYPVVYRTTGVLHTSVLLDSEVSPIDGLTYPGSYMALTQPIHSGGPFIAANLETRASDLFTDASMFVIQESPSGVQPSFDKAASIFRLLMNGGAP
jgi:phosphatidylserine/phosphatidylglycerophosphate/cardiolipin synthase-like enzyme